MGRYRASIERFNGPDLYWTIRERAEESWPVLHRRRCSFELAPGVPVGDIISQSVASFFRERPDVTVGDFVVGDRHVEFDADCRFRDLFPA